MKNDTPYPSDLTEAQWQLLAPLVPAGKPGGRPLQYSRRSILNGILFVVREGCTWRAIPRNLAPWGICYHYYRLWRNDGTWARIHEALRGQCRRQAGRHPEPHMTIVDSQSIKHWGRGLRGYDGNKKILGRKRHVAVDSHGHVLEVVVSPANIPDPAGAKYLLRRMQGRFPRLQRVIVDGGYKWPFLRWVQDSCGWQAEEVKPPPRQHTFQVLPKRWLVERTFGWYSWWRRLNRDYEVLLASSEAMVWLAGIHRMVRRLART